MVVNTANDGGMVLTKHFRVFSNDPRHGQAVLVVTGKVLGYVDVSPERVVLTGRVGQRVERKVRILPEKEYPFTIKSVTPTVGKNIRVDIKPLGKNPSRSGYLLTIVNIKKSQGSYGDYVEIKTDLKEKPTFGIPVIGHVYAKAAKTQ